MSLENTKKFIEMNHHLPNITSAENVSESGMNIAEMNILLLEKVEELTLHLIKINEELNQLKAAK